MLLFKAVMSVGALFNQKIRLGVEGRQGLRQRVKDFRERLPTGAKVVWFHSASLGEFEQGRPVIEAFRERYPGYYIVLTFFSPSGYEIRKGYNGADLVCYIPIDTAGDSKWFVEQLRPELTFFIKYEFWFNFLKALQSQQSNVISFSTIFRPQQIFFKWYGGFYRSLLGYFDTIFVQNQESIELLKGIGVDHCQLAGDTRFDRVSSIAKQATRLPLIENFKEDMPCLIAGSVWAEDMEVLIPALNRFAGQIKVVIAPHEIKSEQMKSWMVALSAKSVLYSGAVQKLDPDVTCIMIDNIGMLSSLYSYGDMGYIGGSFGAGLHNILEAATFGMPVMFGNKAYHKFQEANALMERGGAFAIADSRDAELLIREWIENPPARIEIGSISAAFVESQTGATAKIMGKVEELLKNRSGT